MTVYSSDSPKKAGYGNKRRFFQKKNVCFWMMVAVLPFLVMRLVFFYASPFLLIEAPSGSEADLRTEVKPPPLDLPHSQSDSSPAKKAPSSEPSPPPPSPKKKADASPPPKQVVVIPKDKDPQTLKQEQTAPSPDDDDAGVPEDNEKEGAEDWQAPPPAKAVEKRTAPALAPSAPGECDLYDGDWIPDPVGPLYTNSTCFYMQHHQNCMTNGRPDTGYLYWKWKPRHCDLPRFDAEEFLKSFWGKTIGFVGDSLSRNQMQSLLCMLSQVEIPDMVYQSEDDKNVRWLFKKHQVTLATVWSPYLLQETTQELKGFGEGTSKLYTDLLDDGWTSVMKDFDVMILSIGQWYFKSSIYIEKGEVIGCHYCPGENVTEIGFFQAYRKAVREVLDKVSRDFKGISIMSTFAMSHFENGSWDSGGSCVREEPLPSTFQLQGLDNDMHQIVIEEYASTLQKKQKKGKKMGQLGLLDVTKLSLLRADGHPGPYRDFHPFENKAPGQHVQNDCLHWCLPGPADTWNQLLLKTVSNLSKK